MFQRKKGQWALMLGLTLSAGTAAQAVPLTGSASGGAGGRVGLGGDVASSVPLATNAPATTGTHGVSFTTVDGSILSAQSVTNTNVPGGTLGFASQMYGFSNWPADGYNYNIGGGASAYYSDEFVVTSSTLAAGTAVKLTFSIQVAYAGSITHTVPGGTSASNSNYSHFLASVAAGASPVFSDSSLTNPTFHMDSNDNKTYSSTADTTPPTTLGVFGTGHVDYTIDAKVGEHLYFSLNPNIQLDALVKPDTRTYPGQSATATGSFVMGVAFGVTGAADLSSSFTSLDDVAFNDVAGDVGLVSYSNGVALPGTENATQANALAAMPVPEPASAGLLAGGAAMLMRRTRR